jgi:hypothetical protein
MIDAIRDVSHISRINTGKLKLPKTLDTKKYAVKWAEMGLGVESAQEPQYLGEGKEAEGWTVWRDPKTKKPCSRIMGNKRWVCMVRSRILQDSVNAHYGNVSKKRVIQQKTGETLHGDDNDRQGLITSKDLGKFSKEQEEDLENKAFKFNKVDTKKRETIEV